MGVGTRLSTTLALSADRPWSLFPLNVRNATTKREMAATSTTLAITLNRVL